jgi:hypothetical protein
MDFLGAFGLGNGELDADLEATSSRKCESPICQHKIQIKDVIETNEDIETDHDSNFPHQHEDRDNKVVSVDHVRMNELVGSEFEAELRLSNRFQCLRPSPKKNIKNYLASLPAYRFRI